MKILRNIDNLKKDIAGINNLGFVPTMGGLHNGHLSLIKKSKKICKKTLISIYVNPYQFNSKNDFLKYPISINKDLKILRKIKVDFIFIPQTKDIYKNKRYKKLIIHNKKKIMCGKFRKGHFESVIDVIDRFLNIINPKYMFLGEKDYQQLFLIKNYVKKKFRVKIIPCKTVRDKNYVALSSRNKLLSKNELIISGKISTKLRLFKKKILMNGFCKKEFEIFKNYLTKNFLIKLEYLEIRDEKNLSNFNIKNKFRIFIAYYINKIRLIDNF